MAQLECDSTEQLKLVTQELDSLRKKCEEYKDIICFQANEIKNLRNSQSENICQRCKSSSDHKAAKEPERVSTIAAAANARAWNATDPPSCSPCPCSNRSPHHFSSQNNIDIAASVISFNRRVKKELDVKVVHSLMHEGRVCCVRFSRDGKHLAATSGRATHIYDVANWESICVLQDISQQDKNGEINRGVEFSADGTCLAVASADRLIRVWEISRQHVRNVFKGHRNSVRSVNFSPDGRLLASASFDGTVRIWSMRDGTSKVLESNSSLYSLAFSPDQMYLVAGDGLGVLRVWNVQTGQLVNWLEEHTSTVRSVAFLADGKGLMSGSWDHTLKFWDTGSLQTDQRMRKDKNHDRLKRKALMPSFLDFQGHKGHVNSVAISSNGRWVASGSADHSVHIWDAQNAEMQCRMEVRDVVLSVHFSSVGNYLASSDFKGHVRIWHCEEK